MRRKELPEGRCVKRMLEILGYAVQAVELLVAIALVLMAFGAVVQLFVELFHMTEGGIALPADEFTQLIGTVLEVFIIVELFRIAVAYMRHQNVIPTVLEAALVAIARQFVVFEGPTDYLQHAIGLALLLIAVAIGWFLLERSHACELHE
jgi:uncharacterized membrane protein (DUF373 family)